MKNVRGNLLPIIVMLAIVGCGSPTSTPSTKVTEKKSAETKSESAKSTSARVIVPTVDNGKPRTAWDPNGVADFALTERSGRTVKRADLLGKPWVVCFIFTHCAGPCTAITGEMSSLQQWLKTNRIDDVKLVTITVDPKRDTPEVMQRYSENFGADKDRWVFLTGDEAVLYKLIKTSFGQPVYQQTGEDRKPGWEVFHTFSVMLVDEKGKIVEEYNGKYPTEMIRLRNRIRDWKKTGNFTQPDFSMPVQARKPKTGSRP